jgi:hypothetical protein
VDHRTFNAPSADSADTYFEPVILTCERNLVWTLLSKIFLFYFFDANERRFIAKGNKPTLIRASSRARQQKQGGQSQDNYQLIERHEGGDQVPLHRKV